VVADADAILAGLQACHTRLTSNGIDVLHYNSYQVASDIAALMPALVLSGEYDPVTPPTDGAQVASNLSMGQYLLFNGLGHGVLRGDIARSGQLSCAQKILFQFLDEPELVVDDSCVEELPGAFD
jgi:pimeloyl-ACP methyl ester carboxylesterase